MTKLIVDSTCDLNAAMRKHPKLEYLPLNIIIDGKSYKDAVEIDLELVYEAMRKGDPELHRLTSPACWKYWTATAKPMKI